MDKIIRWVLIGIVVLFAIKAFFNHSLSRKAEIQITKLEAERNNLKRMIGDHQVKIEALKRDTAELAVLINLTYQDIRKKESALKELKIKIKQHEKEDIAILHYSDSVMDGLWRARYPISDSIRGISTAVGIH